MRRETAALTTSLVGWLLTVLLAAPVGAQADDDERGPILGIGGGAGRPAALRADPADVVLRDCWTCEGKGARRQDCWVCRGDGKHACPHCRRFAPKRRSRSRRAHGPDLSFMVRTLEIDLPDFDLSGALIGKKGPGRVEPKPGEIRCPRGCRGGKLATSESWIDCKLCRGGKHDCVLCRKGEVKCGSCDRKRSAVLGCDDCAGTGKVPDPAKLDPAICPWCLGTERRTCGTCPAVPVPPVPCATCVGVGEFACSLCKGVEDVACSQCLASGLRTLEKECRACSGRGTMPCDGCDRGVRSCSSCDSAPLETPACEDCSGRGEHPCNGCFGGNWGAWLSTARAYLGAGEPERARPWAQIARLRCEKRFAAIAKNPFFEQLVEEERGAERGRRKELARTLREIDALLKEIEKASNDAERDARR